MIMGFNPQLLYQKYTRFLKMSVGWYNRDMKWKPVLTFEDRFRVSDNGQIYDIKKKRLRKFDIHTAGYLRLPYWNNGKKNPSWFYVHRIVGQAFIPNPENKPCINHLNGDKTDNRVENLEWCTRAENLAHARETGLAYTKLTKEQVIEIRERFAKGESKRGLGRLFNTNPRNIDFIVKREHWVNI